MGLLIIDNYDSFTYNLIQLIEKAGYNDYKVVFNDQIPDDYNEMYDRFLITPGPGIPVDVPFTLSGFNKNSIVSAL